MLLTFAFAKHVILNGKAKRKVHHFKEVFEHRQTTDGVPTNIFHFGEIPIPEQ